MALDLDDVALSHDGEGKVLVCTDARRLLRGLESETRGGQTRSKRAVRSRRFVQEALKARLKIAFGTDCGGFPWTDHRARVCPDGEVWHGADGCDSQRHVSAAELLDRAGQLERFVREHSRTSFGVAGDPLAEIHEPGTRALVMKARGKFQERNEIDDTKSKLRRAVQGYNSPIIPPKSRSPCFEVSSPCKKRIAVGDEFSRRSFLSCLDSTTVYPAFATRWL